MSSYPGPPRAPAGGGRDLFTCSPPGPSDLGYHQDCQPWELYALLLERQGEWVTIRELLEKVWTTNHRRIFSQANQCLETKEITRQWGCWMIENNGAKGGESAYRLIPVDSQGQPIQ